MLASCLYLAIKYSARCNQLDFALPIHYILEFFSITAAWMQEDAF